jgi:multicomponent Na+:H+ antiporter subunit D
MTNDPRLLAALPIVLPAMWALLMLLRIPKGFLALAPPIVSQWAAAYLLGAYVHSNGTIRIDLGAIGMPAGAMLRIDGLCVLLLSATTLIISACAFYSVGYFHLHRWQQTRTLAREKHFWPLLALLWGALSLLWMSHDFLTTYLALEALGLSAAAMMVLPDRPSATRAGLRYLFYMLLGSLCFLLGTGICYGVYAEINLEALARSARPGGAHFIAMALMSAGLMLKAAIFPLHGWLPDAHSHAWTPVSAIHAALVVKGSFFVFAKVWIALSANMEAAAHFIGWAGSAAIVWGGLMAFRKQHIKHIVAYSTISQLGYLLLFVPLSMNAGERSAQLAWQGVWLLFFSHAFAKAALFLTVDNLVSAMGRTDLEGLSGVDCYLPLSILSFGIASVSIIGLPVSGGFTAKWLLMHSALLSGQWQWVVVLTIGTLLGAAYIFRVFKYTLASGMRTDCYFYLPVSKEIVALTLALTAVLLGLFPGWPLALLGTGIETGAP